MKPIQEHNTTHILCTHTQPQRQSERPRSSSINRTWIYLNYGLRPLSLGKQEKKWPPSMALCLGLPPSSVSPSPCPRSNDEQQQTNLGYRTSPKRVLRPSPSKMKAAWKRDVIFIHPPRGTRMDTLLAAQYFRTVVGFHGSPVVPLWILS